MTRINEVTIHGVYSSAEVFVTTNWWSAHLNNEDICFIESNEKQVRNYDVSWTEWGNRVGLPIEKSA